MSTGTATLTPMNPSTISSAPTPASNARKMTVRILLSVAALIIVSVLVWQGITEHGSPNPLAPNTKRASAIIDIAVLVFREGLESILILSTILANMSGAKEGYRKPIVAGIGLGVVVTILTWFVAVGILSDLSENVSALNLQAGTGLLAIIVLLVVMNWFFHKLYWGGWISLHNRKKREFINEAEGAATMRAGVLWGLIILGFTSFYREGFEVVLFLQSYRLKLGTSMVMTGMGLGLFFTAIVAVLNFIAHRKLPYRKMLVLTGIMLGFVLLVMVGEQVFEMQQANWIGTHTITALEPYAPDWMGVWFGFFPNWECLLGQAAAFILVVGSYFLQRHFSRNENDTERFTSSPDNA